MARDGIAEITWVSPGYQASRFPIFSASELPFLISQPGQGSAAVDAWYRKHAEKEMKELFDRNGYSGEYDLFADYTRVNNEYQEILRRIKSSYSYQVADASFKSGHTYSVLTSDSTEFTMLASQMLKSESMLERNDIFEKSKPPPLS